MRPADEISLDRIKIQFPEQGKLFLILHPLRNHQDIEAVRYAGQRADEEVTVAFPVFQLVGIGPVDLDIIGAQGFQIAEIRKAVAEMIQAVAMAKLLDLSAKGADQVQMLHRAEFDKFEAQLGRGGGEGPE